MLTARTTERSVVRILESRVSARRTSESDNLIRMKEMTATEVARNFSAVLDSVEAGETVVITRGGERVATVAPAPRANGAALAEVIRGWQGEDLFDDEFVANLAWIRDMPAELDSGPWRE
jgi:prevent-host-death family protein